MEKVVFPAEWSPQSAVLITWPHADTDWIDILDDVIACYVAFSKEIVKHEKLLVVCTDERQVLKHFSSEEQKNIALSVMKSNDTWSRDHGPLSVFVNATPTLFDFGFNGWGLKFAANHDNRITGRLFESGMFNHKVNYRCKTNFILEGGSLESDGQGTLLTTSQCLLAPNRNQPMHRDKIEQYLSATLGARRILWLNHGYISGDDTDCHVDTLARFCDEQTIAYVQCKDPDDEHFVELGKMEQELQSFRTDNGEQYNLLPLPMADAVYHNGCRLPATYANFLIINRAVLMPAYESPKDIVAAQQLQKAFPGREVVSIDCRPLIRQHGSLHCVTMQIPMGFL